MVWARSSRSRRPAPLAIFADQILTAAEEHQYDPATVPPGETVARDMSQPGGPHVTGWVGEHFIKQMTRPGRKVKRIVAADSKTGVRTDLFGPKEDTLH